VIAALAVYWFFGYLWYTMGFLGAFVVLAALVLLGLANTTRAAARQWLAWPVAQWIEQRTEAPLDTFDASLYVRPIRTVEWLVFGVRRRSMQATTWLR
jgi:hypothetical protein